MNRRVSPNFLAQVGVTVSILLFCFYQLAVDPQAKANPGQYLLAMSGVTGYWLRSKDEDREED